MEPIPIGRRTRLQQAIKDKELREEKKRRWFAARSNWRNRVTKDVDIGVVNNDEVVYESEYEVDVVKPNSIQQNRDVVRNKNLGGIDNDQHENDHDYDGEGKDIPKDDRNDEDSDISLQIIGERWNPDECYEDHSPVSSSESDGEVMSECRGADNGERNSKEMGATASGKVSNFGDSFMEKDGKEIYDEYVDHIGVRNGGNSNVNGLNRKDGRNCRKRKRVSNAGVCRRFDGLVLPREPDNNARQNDFVGRRTRSNFKPKFHMKKKYGTFSCPVRIDDRSSSSSDGDRSDGHEMPDKLKSREYASKRKRGRGRPRRTTYVENEFKPEIVSKHEDDKGGTNAVKRGRGRPRKSKNAVKESRPETERGRLKANEVENIMSENRNAGLENLVSSVSEAYLPLKFNFPGKNSLLDKSKEDEVKGLFSELDSSLQACEVGCSMSCLDGDAKEDNVISCIQSCAVKESTI